MAQLLVPVYEKQAAYLMHLAALAFAFGLIAEIGFRGISTAFVVGWESTWFAQNPEAVKASEGPCPMPRLWKRCSRTVLCFGCIRSMPLRGSFA